MRISHARSRTKWGVVAALGLLFADLVYAGESSGTVIRLYAHSGDIAIFDVGAHTNRPACSVAGNEWAVSLSTPGGRAMYVLLVSAAAQRQTVTVHGTNTCSAWGDREAPSYIIVTYQ